MPALTRMARARPQWTATWAAVWSATSAAARCVFAPSAGSVAGAAVLPAASLRHWRFVVLDAGAPVPASVGVSGDPAPVSDRACPAVAGISDPAWRFPYLEEQGVRVVEDPWRAMAREVEERCSAVGHPARQFLGEGHYFPGGQTARACKVPLPLWLGRRHGL